MDEGKIPKIENPKAGLSLEELRDMVVELEKLCKGLDWAYNNQQGATLMVELNMKIKQLEALTSSYRKILDGKLKQ